MPRRVASSLDCPGHVQGGANGLSASTIRPSAAAATASPIRSAISLQFARPLRSAGCFRELAIVGRGLTP